MLRERQPKKRAANVHTATSPISLATGNTTIEQRDVSLPGLGGGLRLVRTWNSIWPSTQLANQVGLFGPHWRSNFEESVFTGSDGTMSNLTSITDANNNVTTFEYDAFGRVTKTTFPSGNIETYSYDANNNLITKTDRKNQTITYTYDLANRLTAKTYPDSTSVAYTYDKASRLTQVTDPTGTYSFTFDNMGRLISTSTNYTLLPSKTFTTSYTYDKASNRTGFTDPEGGSTTYAYDTLNRLSTLTPPSAFTTGSFGFSYDALSR
ncbi:MAG TPA: DUF6531 domain-containing protein [Terriglobales bacterium]|nr:DUF6531 domain-containing protein [Terriglobales bacterium]